VAEAMVKEEDFWYSTNIKCVGYDQTLYDKLKERWPQGHTTQ
jgi:hypothetical protein